MAHDNPLDPEHLLDHVKDQTFFEVPRSFAEGGHLHIPQVREEETPIVQIKTGVPILDQQLQPLDLQITKFMVLEVAAALIVAGLFIALGQKMKNGEPVKGRFWNMLEAMVTFIRNEVARPAIGVKYGADKFLPYLWTIFFFVLICNLLGMIPWLGSPTGALGTTAMLAFMTFCTVVISGSMKMGFVGFWKAQVPHMDLPFVLAIFLVPMIFAIEVLGLGIKHFVLAVRLLANMMAGHLVLAAIIAFIALAWESMAILGVIPASLLGAMALSLLELFVAFLQAYIFTFLSALFIGAAVHPH